ncbi:MAG: hydantoinase/oxoprolinase family protein [Alphaproteobacteria bacterium]|nr:hydantoinase/oxoprolinase family protein [Alphaproteobacteria bacterium]
MASYLCGIDIGGTFTDCVIVDGDGAVTTAKAPSTPHDFAAGVQDALKAAGAKLGLGLDTLCAEIAMLSHGTTVGTNAIIQKRGARVGLITTRGHNDVIHIMRGSRGLSGNDIRLVVHFPESQKPDPIVPKRLIEGVSERVDCFGKVIVELNEAEAEAAIRRLLEKGVEAIAVCFLWSFLAPRHEARVKQMIGDIAPGMFVTTSHELVPKWGEYERTAAAALNAYIGPLTTGYLAGVARDVKGLGYHQPLQITQCAGGTISVERAMAAPLLTLDSGPVAGVTGSQYGGGLMGYDNVITTDMGGTSFDVGIIHEGKPAFSYTSLVHQYAYYLSKVDIQTIGAGGGSKAWIDETSGMLRVGPESAGADPGPACYGQGGEVATVTDADLVLGYLDAGNFAGGTLRLDRVAAEAALNKIAGPLGLGLFEAAAGIVKIAEFQMADLIRKVTIQKGFDPRDFVLFAFGGAGPVHAGVFARELGVSKVIVPQRETASVWCAFGAAAADVLHVHERVNMMRSPFEVAEVTRLLNELKSHAEAELAADDIAPERQHLRFALDMRHKGQINEVEVEIGGAELSEADLPGLHDAFVAQYERLYGQGASLPGARLEIVTFRCRAAAETLKPRLAPSASLSQTIAAAAERPARPVYWSEPGERMETPVFDGESLVPGNNLPGPAIVETPDTTVAVHPGQALAVDAFGNFELTLEAS